MSTAAEMAHLDGVAGVATAYSSSPELSSPPLLSEEEAGPSPSPNAQLLNHNETAYAANSTIKVDDGGASSRGLGGVNSKSLASATKSATATGTSHTPLNAPPAPRAKEKIKRPRKKTEPKNPDSEGREVKTRKPRAQSGAGPGSRKKQKIESSADGKPASVSAPAARQSKITDLVVPSQPKPAVLPFGVPPNPQPPQNGNYEAISTPSDPFSGSPTQSTPMRSSGQNYDPIRSATIETSSASVSHNPFSPPPPNVTPPRPAFRASASPAISSIIDPQPGNASLVSQPPPFPHIMKTSPTENTAPPLPSPSTILVNPPSTATIVRNVSPPHPLPSQPLRQDQTAPPSAMEMDSEALAGASTSAMSKPCLPAKKSGTSTGPPSTAPSPKPPRQKPAPPPLPSGSGLLSGNLFAVEDVPHSNSLTTTATKPPNIILHVPLAGHSNKVINFARLAEEQYGFAALHPRLAAQKERLARVAAASAALEKTASGGSKGVSAGESADDDMSVDVDHDSDLNGDVAMSNGFGTGAANNSDAAPEAGGVKKRTRKKKIEEYDRDDPFVDDSELAWEESAAASKDGFFVYSGPLVPEGEKITVERADGTVKRGRGRGRGGGGPGSRGGRGSANAAAHSSNTGAASETGGTGRGGRGSAATRKPRVTKAGRAMMEREKVEREKMAVLAAKPTGYPG